MWLEICVGALALVIVLQAILLALLWKQARRLHLLLSAFGGSAAHASTDVPTSMLVTALGRLEHRLSLLELPAAGSPPQASYELAQQLARKGADADQLVAQCGLSRDEARLVVQMHSGTA